MSTLENENKNHHDYFGIHDVIGKYGSDAIPESATQFPAEG